MPLHDNQTHGHANIACVIVAPRQSSSRRDRRNGHPDCRCVPIQIVALHGDTRRAAVRFARRLAFEGDAEKIAVPPNQPTKAHRAESIKRNAEFGRHNIHAVQSKSGATVRNIANTTWVDAVLASEEHQHVAIDRRASDSAAFEVTSGSDISPSVGMWTIFRGKQSRRAEYDRPTALPCWVRMGDNIRCRPRYRFRIPPQRNSLVKLDAGAAG